MKICKLLLNLSMFFSLTTEVFAQEEKITTYKADKFTIEYPAIWETTNDNGTLNFFPKENYGAVTFSLHSGIDFPLEETKKFILEMYEKKDDPGKVKLIQKGDIAEFMYEFADKNVKWVTRAFRKKTDFYLLTINCDLDKWDANKDVFNKVINSFKLN